MKLRDELVKVALEWENVFGVAPRITASIAEYDAAMQIGFDEKEYSAYMQNVSAVQKGRDFIHKNKRFQVKACRPSGKKGCKITKVPHVTNYEWDYFIWIEYNREYEIQEMRCFDREKFKAMFENKKRLCPEDMKKGKQLFPKKINPSTKGDPK